MHGGLAIVDPRKPARPTLLRLYVLSARPEDGVFCKGRGTFLSGGVRYQLRKGWPIRRLRERCWAAFQFHTMPNLFAWANWAGGDLHMYSLPKMASRGQSMKTQSTNSKEVSVSSVTDTVDCIRMKSLNYDKANSRKRNRWAHETSIKISAMVKRCSSMTEVQLHLLAYSPASSGRCPSTTILYIEDIC